MAAFRYTRQVALHFLTNVTLLCLGSLCSSQDAGLSAALALEKTFVQSIEKAGPSVVALARATKGDAENQLFSPDYMPAEYATGVVVDAQGLILTNYHVLGQPDRNDYAVWLNKRPFAAKIKAADPWVDLAILEIEAKNLLPIQFGDASQMKKGQIVISLGNPYAIARDGSASASWGIVSNIGRAPVGRRLPQSVQRDKKTVHHFGTLIQTDARLNKGTSGGALLNLRGEMVGLTTAIGALPGYERAAGFAIPIDDKFKQVIGELKQGRAPEHGFLGVATEPLSIADRQNQRYGVELRSIVSGTPAAQGGLARGDVITHVSDQPVYSTDDLIRLISLMPAGSRARLNIRRFDMTRQQSLGLIREVTLSKKRVAAAQPVIETKSQAAWRGMLVDYTTALPEFVERAIELTNTACVGVIHVEQDSPAWEAGVRVGQLITHVGPVRVENPREFYTAAGNHHGVATITLVGAAEGRSVELRIDPRK